MKVTNTAAGARGVALNDGSTFYLEPGQSEDLDVAGDLYEGVVQGSGDEQSEPGPLDGSIDELTTHLATVSNVDDVQALIDAETAGKSRKGALEALEARRDELLAA